MKPKFCRNWIVRAYKQNSLVDEWEIKGKFQWEASDAAQADIERMGSKVDDFTLTPKK